MKYQKFIDDFNDLILRQEGKFFPLDFIHGFLTAILVSPEFISPNEWIQLLINKNTEFKSKEDAEMISHNILIMYNVIKESLETRTFFTILHKEDEKGEILDAMLWCQGFVYGAEFFKEDLVDLMALEKQALRDIMAIYYLADPKHKLNTIIAKQTNLENEDKQELIDELPAIILALYEFFQGIEFDDFEEHDLIPDQPGTIKRKTPKISRNDPCPCGSGKKYKNCCGKNVT